MISAELRPELCRYRSIISDIALIHLGTHGLLALDVSKLTAMLFGYSLWYVQGIPAVHLFSYHLTLHACRGGSKGGLMTTCEYMVDISGDHV